MRVTGFQFSFPTWWKRRLQIGIAISMAVMCLGVLLAYHRLANTVEARLRQGPFGNSVGIYAAPYVLTTGETIQAEEVAAKLRRSGYSDSASNAHGHYVLRADEVEIHPGADSYFRDEPARVLFRKGRIEKIVAAKGNEEIPQYSLEPQLLFDLAQRDRQKHSFVRYDEIPKVLLDAILSAEDKHFFWHPGIDLTRVVKAAYVNARSGHLMQGGSTLTMQLARSLWLDSRKDWRRKAMEVLITLVLEIKLSKKEILEYYANHIYLGEHETFGIHGFGEAARIYFNKDISQITLPEAAMLAGLVQRPNFVHPRKHPDRMKTRRNVVLTLMEQNGVISAAQKDAAAKTPISLTAATTMQGDAPFFLTMAMDEFRNRTGNTDGQQSYQVHTTLEPDLQRAAMEAVSAGLVEVDGLLRKKRRNATDPVTTQVAQVALVALDAHTGEVRALVGGRDYTTSQINRVLAKRQPGSIFKPFVYAAALSQKTADGYLFHPSSMVDDSPATFYYGNEVYEPNNFEDHYFGMVSLRKALAHSMNLATVKVAERVGYRRVVELAKSAGLNDGLRGTPAVALGSYDVTPMEMAGAYTMFANEGTYVKPTFLTEIRSDSGKLIYRSQPEQRTVLDPKIAFLMRTMLEGVVQSGTGAGVRARGLRTPVAGKTGTSRDGWFAGFTSNLVCVVWVGFDDNSELNLEGAKSALPIWTEFMKRAAKNPYYSAPFERVPEGIITEEIDPESGELAGPLCPDSRSEYFVTGSEPHGACPLHGSGATTNTQSQPGGAFQPAVSTVSKVSQ